MDFTFGFIFIYLFSYPEQSLFLFMYFSSSRMCTVCTALKTLPSVTARGENTLHPGGADDRGDGHRGALRTVLHPRGGGTFYTIHTHTHTPPPPPPPPPRYLKPP